MFTAAEAPIDTAELHLAAMQKHAYAVGLLSSSLGAHRAIKLYTPLEVTHGHSAHAPAYRSAALGANCRSAAAAVREHAANSVGNRGMGRAEGIERTATVSKAIKVFVAAISIRFCSILYV